MTEPGADASTYGPANTDISASSYDWGTNPISNGGGSANVWRTMTSSEWSYILSNGYAKATVGGVDGMVIKPNNWINPQGIGILQTGTDYSANQYSVSEWLVRVLSRYPKLPLMRSLSFRSFPDRIPSTSRSFHPFSPVDSPVPKFQLLLPLSRLESIWLTCPEMVDESRVLTAPVVVLLSPVARVYSLV